MTNAKNCRAQVRVIASKPSWVIENDDVQLAITQMGGQMAPVIFYRKNNKIQPYYISPWQNENLRIKEPVLAPLRGDFFCAPFGGNGKTFKNEKHHVHGEPAGSKWSFVSCLKSDSTITLKLAQQTTVRPGRITKNLSLIDGHNVIYCQHIMEGFSGSMPVGHHPILAVPQDGSTLKINTSPFKFGMTNPTVTGNPANGEYQSLAVGKKFKSLQRVPSLWKRPSMVDCSIIPVRPGFTDIIAFFAQTSAKPGISWTTATFPKAGYLWFVLKNPAVLPSTVLWMCNRGRHGVPWQGRNCCLGVEDTCSYFTEGLAESVQPNILNQSGISTAIKFSPKKPFVLNHIQGVVKVPGDFEEVRDVIFSPGQLTFVGNKGQEVPAKVCHQFIHSGQLA